MRIIPRFAVGAPEDLRTSVREALPVGDWIDPTKLGATRLWYDTINSVFRYKQGSNPTNETDGDTLVVATSGDSPFA